MLVLSVVRSPLDSYKYYSENFLLKNQRHPVKKGEYFY